jgi:hypothetical protein
VLRFLAILPTIGCSEKNAPWSYSRVSDVIDVWSAVERMFGGGSPLGCSLMHMLQTERSRIRIPIVIYLFFFSIYLILPAALGPGIYSASNRNEYRTVIVGRKGPPAREADILTADCPDNAGASPLPTL